MRNRTTDRRLIKTAARLGRPSVYALAHALGRPYRRVLERVKTLALAGQLVLIRTTRDGRPVIQVCMPEAPPAPSPLPLTWSKPQGDVAPDTEIAAALLRPSFSNLLDVSRRHGLARVERAARQLTAEQAWSELTRRDAEHALRNLKVGHARAAAKN